MEDKHTKRDKDDYDNGENHFSVVEEGKNIISSIKGYRQEYNKYPRSKVKKFFDAILLVAILSSMIMMIVYAVGSAGQEEKNPLLYLFSCIFVLLILGYILVITVKEKLAFRKPPADAIRRTVEVLGCTVSSQKEIFGTMTYIYRVMLLVDGENIETFSKREFTVGEKISVYVSDYPVKRCYIP